MLRFIRAAALAFLFTSLSTQVPASAQDAGRIREIVIQGTQRIENETIRSYMAIAEGDPFDADRIDRSLKSLFATGLFADVTLRREGEALVVRVVENPIINRIAFEGNKRVKDDALQAEVQLRPRVVYTRTKVQSDLKRILDVYRRTGRFAATVEPKVIQLEQNRVDLVFEINEGPPTYVRRINFIGNKRYSDSALREILQTKEERWYRFFTSEDTYDPDRLTYDRELLRRYYLKNGHADFRVLSAVAELTPDREQFFITISVEEGDRYKFGDLGVEAGIKDVKTDELKALITPETGDWYNADEVENSIQSITDAVGNQGYAFVDVRPRVNRNREAKTIDVAFEVQEGQRIFVERIDITGNSRTLDKVVRREFRLVEGDAFNTAKMRRSRQRIRDLSFFETVEVTNVPSETSPDRTVVKVDVQEKSTGELSFGVGWSTSSGPIAEVSVRERNLLGRGQDLRSSFSLGTRRTQIDLSFTEPYFLDKNVAAGFDVYSISRKLQRESSYDANSLGGSLRTGYAFNEALRQDWRYNLRRDQVENVQSNASRFIREQQGTATTSSVQHTLTYDKRDSRIEPTEGYFGRVSNEFAGLGGTEKFVRNTLGAGQYYTPFEEYTVSLTGQVAHIVGLGRPIRITDRFFLGGDTLRGFSQAGVSPRDKSTSDSLGGLWSYNGSAQVSFPLGLPNELGIKGHTFADFGSIGETESVTATEVNQSSSVRVAVGAGVAWKSPMGPLSVDFGFPVKKEAFDETEIFRFNFGTRF